MTHQVPVRTHFFRAIRPYRRIVIGLSSISFASTVAEVVAITIIGVAAGRLQPQSTASGILSGLGIQSLVLVGVVISLVKILLDLVLARFQASALFRYEAELRRQLAQLQAHCRWDVLEDNESGRLHAISWTSVNRSREAFLQAVAISTNIASLLVMLAAMIFVAQWKIVLIILTFAVFAFAFRPLISASKRTSLSLREASGTYSGELNESIAMSKEARVLDIQDLLASRLSDASDTSAAALARQSYYSSILNSGYGDVVYLLVILGIGGIYWLEVGNPGALVAMVLLLYRSMSYGRSLQSSLQSIAATGPFIADVHEWIDLLEDNQEPSGSDGTIDRIDTIDLLDVDLVYSNGHVGVRSLTARFADCETIALIGPSGSGKSSLVSMILALRDPTNGEVRINGRPLSEIDRRSLRRRMAFVPQDNLLFNASIEENVQCWRDISPDRVREAMRQANVLDEVLSMESGLSTQVGEGGRRLSGGQRQRICLARALAGDPDLLILDEPTSALDPASEQAVKRSLEAIKGDVLLLVIAHRMTTISICDRVLVLDKGRLLHDGPPDVVATDSKFFAQALELSE